MEGNKTNIIYSYENSVKSSISDELINTYFLRPLAGKLVQRLFYTKITPNQLTLTAIFFGFLAAIFYLNDESYSNYLGALFIFIRNILDGADGQLARAKNLFTRSGRFLDSIGDFFVNIAIYLAISFSLYKANHELTISLLVILCLFFTTIRASYYVFYHTSYLHLQNSYETNRITEDITSKDLKEDKLTIYLQKIFLFIYSWQDRLMIKIDDWCKGKNKNSEFDSKWYSDHIGLRISSFLGLGTELTILIICSISNSLSIYIYINLILINVIFILSIFYRRFILRKKIVQK
jgi:phosphatidylglycerophosphate synthase